MERMRRNNGGYVACNNTAVRNLLRTIQELDFAIYETILYLDVYPNNQDALEYYHTLVTERNTLAAEYEATHGPLTASSNLRRNS